MHSAVLLPGSYDPPTLGHLDIIRRCTQLFDEVHVVIFINSAKKYLFDLQERLMLLRLCCRDLPNVFIDADSGMVVDYAARHALTLVVKGVRNERDFIYEREMAEYNRANGRLETLLLPCDPRYREISSSALRAALAGDEDLSAYLPVHVAETVCQLYKDKLSRGNAQ